MDMDGSRQGVLGIEEMLDVVRCDMEAVERVMSRAMISNIALVEEVAGHVLASGGKRLRPALVLLAGRACGGRGRDLIPLAGAMELVHTATLIHDDIVDGSDTRRGVDTVARRWSPAVAVLTGDLVFARAFSILSDCGDPGVLRLMSRVIADMCLGEIEQYAGRGDLDQTEDGYLDRIGRKTASLMAACTAVGAGAAGAGEARRRAMHDYGYHLGMVFQIRDDILDFEGIAAEMGKGTTADVASGVVTLPLIHALSHPGAGTRIRGLLGGGAREWGPSLAGTVSTLVVEAGGVQHAASVARRYQTLALAAIEGLDPTPARRCLEYLVEFAASRAS